MGRVQQVICVSLNTYMYIAHIALGGCLASPPIRYGITADTGGHIAYVLGAALAQARRSDVEKVDLITRAFANERLGAAHAQATERIDDVVRIRRISGGGTAYLEKEDLLAALPALTESYLQVLAEGPRPDVIHAHFADAAVIALAARARYGIPVVYTPHSLALGKRECGLDSAELTDRIARERRAIADADAIVVSSRDEAERQLCDYGVEAAGRTHRISPGVYLASGGGGTADAEGLLAPFLRHPDRPLILAIARPVAKKNHAALLEAFAKTPGLRDKANLAIVAGLRDGPRDGGPEQRQIITELIEGIDRHDLYGHVALPKRHQPHHIPQLYRLAAARRGVFVNPALHEPFGLTLLEAAANGLPVVATDCGGPQDIVGDLGHGTLVDPTDLGALGRAIRSAIEDEDERAKFAEALADGLGDYAWDSYAKSATDLYRQLLGRSAAGAAKSSRRAASRMLVSDMDGTLTGSRAGVRRLKRVLAEAKLPFVLSTGRSLPEARRIMAKWDLPEPDALVTAVGTEIHAVDASGRVCLDEAYAKALDDRWDRNAVEAALRSAGATFQRLVEQRRWKFGISGDATEAARIEEVLRTEGVNARVTASHGRFIDVTPEGVDKAFAMAWVARRWGLTAAECIACGDSGNDAAMLRAAGRAIIVANAFGELDDVNGPSVIRTGAPYADGIVEALEHLGLTERSIGDASPHRASETRLATAELLMA